MVDPRMFAPADIAGAYQQGAQFRQQQQQYNEQQQNKRRLAELLPQALGYGTQGITQADIANDGPLPTSYETADEGWRAAYQEARQADPSIRSFGEFLQIQQKYRANPQPEMSGVRQRAALVELARISPELFMKLDEHQREQAKKEINDMGAAVRWALQDPTQKAQRWNQVVDFYSRHIPSVARYRDHPELAETALMQLGQMDEYIKSAPKPEYRTVEAGGSLIDVSGGNPRVVIAPNPGGMQTGAPVGGGDIPSVSDQASYDAVPPGAKYRTPDGHIRVKGGQTGGGLSGPFPDIGPYHRY